MEIGIDSFAAVMSHPQTRAVLAPAQRLAHLIVRRATRPATAPHRLRPGDGPAEERMPWVS